MSERIDEKEFVCIICPNSCRLSVWKDPATKEIKVSGNQCPRGKEYGINEYTNPSRMLITTMRIINGVLPVIPVRSNKEIPKARIFDAMKLVNESFCKAPIKMGDIIIENLLGLEGIHVIASRDMEAVETEGATEELIESDIKERIAMILRNRLPQIDPLTLKDIQEDLLQLIENK